MKKGLLMMAMLFCMGIVGTQAQVIALSENFESGIPSGWTILDVDNDGATWSHPNSGSDPCLGGHNSSDGYLFSYDNPTVDNWLITPAITLGTDATLTFWRCTQFFQYAEHYGVYVSTTTPEPSAFTLVYEETGIQAQYAWREREIDLSAYDGNTVYIAFRHFNSNVNLLAIDDITLTMNTSVPTIEATPMALDFGVVPMGTPSPSQEVNVTTFNITGAVTASVSGSFEISLDDSIFSPSVTMPSTGGTLYVRYFPMNVGSDTDLLVLTSSGIMLTVNLTGESMDCGDISLPFYEDFDSSPEYSIPTCWRKINPYQGYPMISSSYVYSVQSMMFKCDPSTGEPTYLVMPELPQDLSNMQISFWTRRGGTSAGPFSVGYMTDPADGSTFVPVWTKTGAEIPNYSYYPFVVDFSNVNIDPSLSYYIAFKYQTTSSASWHVDNVMVELIPDCNSPADLTVNSVDGNSANVSWTGDASSYEVYYRRSTDTEWVTIPNVTIDTNGFTLTNLDPTTNYVWYVASVCEDGTLVSSLNTSTFQTECAILLAPFSEDFNAQNAIPYCWEKLTGYASAAFAGNNPTSYSGGWVMTTVPFDNYHPRLNIWGTTAKHWLVTPPIDLSDLANPALTFDLALTNHNSADPIISYMAQDDDIFMVIISTDNGATWSAANATIWCDNDTLGDYPYSQISNTAQEVVIPLTAYANQTVKIAFYGESTVGGSDNDVHIDNVYVGEASSCPKPTGLTVDSITHDFAHITWNGYTGIGAWTVEYKTENDTDWNSMSVTDTNANLVGLTPVTTYTVRVIAHCGDGGYSLPSMVNFTTQMAVQGLPYSTDFAETSDRNWVLDNGNRPNYWTIGSVGSESALYITNNGTTAGYTPNGAFSIVSAEKLFNIGTAEEVTLSFNVKVGGEGTSDYLKVFFAPADASYPSSNMFETYANYDYSVNSIVFPTTASAYPYMINLTNGNAVSVTVDVPNPNTNPTANSTAKLVFLWKNDQSDGSQPGAIIYNVSVSPVSCSKPTDLVFENITTSTAVVSWTPTGTATTWNLEYKEASASSWNSVVVTNTPSYTLTGLATGAQYQVRVQTDCGDSQSLWESGTFSTFCDAVTNFPYTEDFENGGLMPDCWSQSYDNGVVNWIFKAGNYNAITSAHSGSYNAYFFADNNNNYATKLISPVFDLTGVSSPYLTFWYTHAAWGNDLDYLTVYYRTSPTSEWQELTMHTTSVTTWTMDSIALPNPSSTYQIAFKGLANYGYGITLDDITIAAGPAPAVTDPTVATTAATGVTQTVATLNGVITNPDNVTITAKGFEWKETAGGTYAPVTVTGNNLTYNLTGLTASTSYTYKAFITYNGTTVYGSEVAFTTLDDVVEPCEAPTELHQIIALKELGGIDVTWLDNAGVSEWNLQYRPLNGEWITVVVTGQPAYYISGLVNGEDYEIRVQAVCGPDNLSEWSSILTATATNSGIEEFLTNSVTLYPNPANDVINVQCTMNDVQVKAIEVFDVYGKVIRTEETLRATSLQTVQINVSDFASGMYFVRLTTEEGVVTKSFVKK